MPISVNRLSPLVVVLISIILVGCAGSRPAHLGQINTKLENCPDSPNCVSSLAEKTDQEHYIPAIEFDGHEKSVVYQRIVQLIESDEQALIVVKSPDYIYSEYTSELMGFVDDVEFLFANDAPRVHVRSASRLGYRDFGVNRERIEAIRNALIP